MQRQDQNVKTLAIQVLSVVFFRLRCSARWLSLNLGYNIVDKAAGRDGLDIIFNVEYFQFADINKTSENIIAYDIMPNASSNANYDLALFAQLAQISRFAYPDTVNGSLDGALSMIGWSLCPINNGEATCQTTVTTAVNSVPIDAHAICAIRSEGGRKEMVIAFEGTNGDPDVTTDASNFGFTEYYKSIRTEVVAWLKEAVAQQYDAIYITGHSLGGAAAQIALLDIVGDQNLPIWTPKTANIPLIDGDRIIDAGLSVPELIYVREHISGATFGAPDARMDTAKPSILPNTIFFNTNVYDATWFKDHLYQFEHKVDGPYGDPVAALGNEMGQLVVIDVSTDAANNIDQRYADLNGANFWNAYNGGMYLHSSAAYVESLLRALTGSPLIASNSSYTSNLITLPSAQPTLGNDLIYLTSQTINDQAGNNALNAFAGNDILVAGSNTPQSALIIGAEGSDSYIVKSLGVNISITGPSDEHLDNLYFNLLGQISTGVSGDNLVVTFDTGGETQNSTVEVVGWFSGTQNYQLAEIGKIRAIIGNYWDYQSFSFDSLQIPLFREGTANDDNKILGSSTEGDLMHGYAGNDALDGRGGNDSLYGGGGADRLNGGADYDLLYGGDGNDTLMTWDGHGDLLSGQVGDDSYEIMVPIGQTVVIDDAGSGTDTLTIIAPAATAANTRFHAAGNDMEVWVYDSSNTLLSFTTIREMAVSSGQIETMDIDLNNRTLYRFDLLKAWNAAINGSENGEYNGVNAYIGSFTGGIYNGDSDDPIIGTDGNDRLYGYGGNDIISPGQGSDYVDAGSGNDTVNVVAVRGSGQSDTLDGGSGIDTLNLDYSEERSYSSWNDYYYSCSFNYSVYNEQNTVTILHSGSSLNEIQTALATAVKTVFDGYNTDVTASNFEVINLKGSQTDNFMICQFVGSYDGQDGIDSFYADWSDKSAAVNWNNLYTGVAYTYEGFTISNVERLLLQTGSGSDVINTVFMTDNDVRTGGGDDTISLAWGNDNVVAGEGNDTISSGGGNDCVDGGSGNDIINPGAGSNTVDAGAGDDTVNALAVESRYQSNTLDGGTGTDTLNLDYTDEKFYAYSVYIGYFCVVFNYYGFNYGIYDSQDTVTILRSSSSLNEIQTALATAVKTVFDGYITDVTFHNFEVINFKGSQTDNLLIYQLVGTYDGQEGTDTFYADWSDKNARVNWTNTGSAYTYDNVRVTGMERLLLQTGSGADVIDNMAFNTDNDVRTGAGNDTINLGSGYDNVVAGEGNDIINPGGGSDYVDAGAGKDTIEAGGGNDTILGGDGFDTVVFTGNFADYVISYDDTAGTVTVFDSVANRDGIDVICSVENFQFADTIETALNHTPIFLLSTGKVTTEVGFSSIDVVRSAVMLSNGKIIVAGMSNNDFALARYNADGSLDLSFDGDGKAIADFGLGYANAQGVTLQSDGKILLTGYIVNENGNVDFALVRYNFDGSLDSGFDSDGMLATPVGLHMMNLVQNFILQSNGKILVAGCGDSFSGVSLVRYNSDGSLDSSFDSDGSLILPRLTNTDPEFGLNCSTNVAFQSDGKILVVGTNNKADWSGCDYSLVRYNSNGSLDTSFDGDGRVTTDLGFIWNYAQSVTTQADGKILVSGFSHNESGSVYFYTLVRYNNDGSLDTSFDGDGKVVIDVGTTKLDLLSEKAITLQSDGKILIAGYSLNITGSGYQFALLRYNSDGSLDMSFDGDGMATTNVVSGSDVPSNVIVQTDGKILVAGSHYYSGNYGVALVRYNSDGSLDPTFGSTKYVENALPVILDSNVQVYDMELSATGSYAGATLLLQRNGGSSSTDLFSNSIGGTLGALSQGGNLLVGDTIIGKVLSNFGGKLELSFNSSATESLVNTALSQITYSNNAHFLPISVQIEWTFSDGNTGSQGGGGALIATGSTIVQIIPDTIAPTISTFMPASSTSDVAIDSNLLLTFNEPIQKGTGTIAIHSGSATGPVVESYDTATSVNLTVSGATLTINPTSDLADGTHYYITLGAGALKDIAGNSFAGTDAYDFTTAAAASLHDLNGSATFWKTGLPITAITSTLASAPAATGTHPIEFRNIQTATDGTRTIEIWETSPTAALNSVLLELALPTGSTALWQDATGLPSGWNSSPNTDKPGQFILGGIGTTALSAGSVKLGTLTLTAPTNLQHFELSLTTGQLGNDTIPAFGLSSDSMTTGTDGLYQHLAMDDGTYTLTSTKVSGTAESNAVKANDALAALKIAVGINPNADGSAVSPYQYLAADVNHDGQVKAADALNILKMAVKLSSAPEMEWLFVTESVGSESMSRTHVVWPDNPIPVTLDMDQDVHLIGIVKGDVDGSWAA